MEMESKEKESKGNKMKRKKKKKKTTSHMEEKRKCKTTSGDPTFTVHSGKRKSGQRKNVHFFFYPFLLVLPTLLLPLPTSDAGFPCLSFKCHCVFKSNKLIADCIGLNAIPEVSKVPINSPFTCYFL